MNQESQITMNQDDIHLAIKTRLVQAGYLSDLDAEGTGWLPVHQKAWESFAFHKLNLANYSLVPNSQEQLDEAFKSETSLMEVDLSESSSNPDDDAHEPDASTEPPLDENTSTSEGASDSTPAGNSGTDDTSVGAGSAGADDTNESTGEDTGAGSESEAEVGAASDDSETDEDFTTEGDDK